jgi:hypothetical protein
MGVLTGTIAYLLSMTLKEWLYRLQVRQVKRQFTDLNAEFNDLKRSLKCVSAPFR